MTVIADISVPLDAFVVGRALHDVSSAQIELERVVPIQRQVAPLVWISSHDRKAVEANLRTHPETDAVYVLARTDEKTLFEVEWTDGGDSVVDAIRESRGQLLRGTATADGWNFRLQFGTHEDLSRFNVALTEAGIPVTLRHLYDPGQLPSREPLSPKQLEALLAAYRQGYFDVPRRITQAELAERFELSDTAFSQRLRRAIASLIEQRLRTEDQYH